MNAATTTWTLVDSYPFRQPERVFFNPFNQNEMWVSSFGNGLKMGLMNVTNAVPEFTQNKLNMNAFPNPFSDHLQVIMKNEIQGETLIITDIQGRILEKVWADQREIQLDTKKWQKGIYFLKNRQE